VHDHGDALEIATSTGALLLSLRERRRPGTPEEFGRLADRMANEHLLRELAARRPDDAVRSEESEFRPGRGDTSRVWIVDPLDGTWEYGQGRDDWGVNVALALAGRPIAAAMVLPAAGCVLGTGERWEVPRRGAGPRILVSRSHTPAFAGAVAARLGAELQVMGSVRCEGGRGVPRGG
jgi:3'(2'), 5'-bisphosphate nucleotidase